MDRESACFLSKVNNLSFGITHHINFPSTAAVSITKQMVYKKGNPLSQDRGSWRYEIKILTGPYALSILG